VEMGGEKTFVGFLGWVNYKVIDHPEWHRSSHEEMATWLNTLLMFGELIGVGHMRNMGFGRIRFEVKRK
ncbi:MAG: CRISPR system precrRNA processing endoribonuclease RAMP protein Cas6, partial [Candidatus Korarchaeum sp.]